MQRLFDRGFHSLPTGKAVLSRSDRVTPNPEEHLSEFLANAKGSMTVEFVAFAPPLLAALMVAFEFGRAFWAYDVVTRDLRAAVRYLSRASVYDTTTKSEAENVAKTGTPGGTTLHFPWTAGASFAYSETTFTAAQFSDAGHSFTMTATVPIELSLLEVLNRLQGWVNAASGHPADSAIPLGYSLTISYQARYIGN